MNYESPPAPSGRSPSNDVWRVLLFFALGGLILFLIFAGLVYWLISSAIREGPKPAPQLGKFEVVKRFDDRSAHLRFKDLGIEITLPAEPTVVKPPAFDEIDRISLRQYAYYRWETDVCDCYLDGAWYRLGVKYTPRELYDLDLEWLKEDEELSEVAGSFHHRSVPIGRAARFSYKSDGVSEIEELLYYTAGSRSIVMTCYFVGENAQAARAEIETITDSIKLVDHP